MTDNLVRVPRSRHQRGVLAALLILVGLIASALATAPFASAATAPTVTLTHPTTVYVGYPAALTVSVTNPAAAGENVTLEKFNGLLWGTVETKALDATSKATFTVTPASASSVKYRARIAASAAHAAGTSATYTMVPVLKAPTITLTGPSYVVINTTGTLTASVTDPTAAGEKLSLQKWTGLSWTTSGSATLDASSQASLPVTPTSVGTTRYRVTIAKSAKHATANSNEFVLNAVATRPFDCGGGVQPQKSPGVPWVCTYNDEFNGTTLDTDYWTQGTSAATHQYPGPTYQLSCKMANSSSYTTNSVHDGVLELFALVLPAPVDCGGGISSRMVSGEVFQYLNYFQTYGRYEVRAKLPDLQTKGLQETLWLWPENQVGDGEIDFAEFYSVYPSLNFPVMHYAVDKSTINTTTHHNTYTTVYGCPINVGQFNTYRLEWSPGNAKMYINDVLCLENNYQASNTPTGSPAPFNRDFFVALTQAFGTDAGGDNVFPLATGPTSSSTKIDYVRIWK